MPAVLEDPFTRCTTLMFVPAGTFIPGFAATIAGSSHVLILREKIFASRHASRSTCGSTWESGARVTGSSTSVASQI